MKNKLRSFMVLAALAVCFGTFSVTAYAQSNEPQTEPAPVEETTEPEETAEPNPFTPNGTGTVLDNATSEDEKEFYTIVTEDENVFYLVIDKPIRKTSTSSMRSRSPTCWPLPSRTRKKPLSRWNRSRNPHRHRSRRSLPRE